MTTKKPSERLEELRAKFADAGGRGARETFWPALLAWADEQQEAASTDVEEETVPAWLSEAALLGKRVLYQGKTKVTVLGFESFGYQLLARIHVGDSKPRRLVSFGTLSPVPGPSLPVEGDPQPDISALFSVCARHGCGCPQHQHEASTGACCCPGCACTAFVAEPAAPPPEPQGVDDGPPELTAKAFKALRERISALEVELAEARRTRDFKPGDLYPPGYIQDNAYQEMAGVLATRINHPEVYTAHDLANESAELLRKRDADLSQARASLAELRWASTEERIPEPGVYVLVRTPTPFVAALQPDGRWLTGCCLGSLNPTHWMPIRGTGATPGEEPAEQCLDCGEVIVGAHGCQGRPGEETE